MRYRLEKCTTREAESCLDFLVRRVGISDMESTGWLFTSGNTQISTGANTVYSFHSQSRHGDGVCSSQSANNTGVGRAFDTLEGGAASLKDLDRLDRWADRDL